MQFCLTKKISGRKVDQMKAAYVEPVLQSDALVEQITGERMTDNQIFNGTLGKLINLEISQYTEHRIQETLDDAAF